MFLGAPLVWAGIRLIIKPVESAKRMEEILPGGRRLQVRPEWRPDELERSVKVIGAVCATIGTALVAGGVMLLVASGR